MLLARLVERREAAAELIQRREGDVFADAHQRHDAIFFAVLRHHGDALGYRLLTVANLYFLIINPDIALPAPRPDAEQALNRFGAAGADQPGDAEDLAALQGEGNVVDAAHVPVNRMPGGKVFNAQHRVADGVPLMRIERGQLSSHHHGNNVILAESGGWPGGDGLAVADDADGIGDRFHLVELVGDVDAGDAMIAQVVDNAQQHLGFTLSQRRGRLIEDQEPHLLIQRAGDLDQLLLPQAQIADPGVGRDVEPHPRQQLLAA